MRPRVSWMTEIDDVILEYLHGIGEPYGYEIVQPPKTVWHNLVNELEVIDRSPATVRRRMQTLEDMGLLERPDVGGTYYRLTDKGRRYVEGDITLSELGPDSEE